MDNIIDTLILTLVELVTEKRDHYKLLCRWRFKAQTSGLRSRCTTPWRWQKATTLRICKTI